MQFPALSVDYGNMVHHSAIVQMMMRSQIVVTFVLWCGLFAQPSLAVDNSGTQIEDPLAKIERAYEDDRLSFDERAILQATAIVCPDKLPSAFSIEPMPAPGRVPSREATLILLDIRNSWNRFSPESRAALALLLARPVNQKSWASPYGFFRLHYDTSGTHQVPMADTNGNAIPDFVERCAAFLDTSLAAQLALGYFAPPSDTGLGGDSLYDVYFREISYYGYATTDGPGPAPWNDALSYLVLNRDFTGFPPNNDPEGDALGSARATCAHEFHHAVQYGYDTQEAGWFMEFDATHMEELIFEQVDDNYAYLPDYLQHTDVSLMQSGLHSYGAFIWGLFLADRYDATLIRSAWAGARYDDVFPALSDSLRVKYGASIDSAFGEFCAWNYLTGARDDGNHYAEGSHYPAVTLAGIHDVFPIDTTVCASHPQGYGACYVQFIPTISSVGRYRLEFDGSSEGRWLAYVVKSATVSSHEIVPISLDPVSAYGFVDIESFHTYHSIALVAVNTRESMAGASFDYWVHPSTVRAVSIHVVTPDSSVYSASSRDWEFRFDNPSPLGDLYEVRYADDSGWVTPDTIDVYVAAGSSAVRTLTVTPHKGTPTGAPLGINSRIHVSAVSKFDPWVSDTLSTPAHTVFQYGDIDFDGLVTMGDLTILIDHLFISLASMQPVQEAGNCDCVEIITMSDLTVLISFLFIDPSILLPCNPY